MKELSIKEVSYRNFEYAYLYDISKEIKKMRSKLRKGLYLNADINIINMRIFLNHLEKTNNILIIGKE